MQIIDYGKIPSLPILERLHYRLCSGGYAIALSNSRIDLAEQFNFAFTCRSHRIWRCELDQLRDRHLHRRTLGSDDAVRYQFVHELIQRRCNDLVANDDEIVDTGTFNELPYSVGDRASELVETLMHRPGSDTGILLPVA